MGSWLLRSGKMGYGKGILSILNLSITWYYGHNLKGGFIVSGGIRLEGRKENKGNKRISGNREKIKMTNQHS